MRLANRDRSSSDPNPRGFLLLELIEQLSGNFQLVQDPVFFIQKIYDQIRAFFFNVGPVPVSGADDGDQVIRRQNVLGNGRRQAQVQGSKMGR